MNKEQVIELANQVGAELDARGNGSYDDICFTVRELQRFANLVGNAKLEEAAQECEQIGNTDDYCTAMTMVNAINKLLEPTP